MKTFKAFIEFLNKLKSNDFFGDEYEGLSEKEIEYMTRTPSQNPYGLIGLFMGGLAFVFGPEYGFIPIIALIFCIVTLFTFDKEKEDNPWPFYIGITLSLIGLSMFLIGETHHLVV